ncbi:hypothetical protein [Actinomadura citrea]|uniref:ATP-binding protein n=1 Tax=Actinomadura citrea TaxID=46158 RepID=A0A7Y9GCV7_9ACTN|nr:hypothetical protein [Actinomadura citrea]NYE14175.1 hypothetical protein [Actinomadura citrea]GGU02606.1 hypothetical protein GCM10010177_72670 [Actinomadura citrea]
MTVVPAQDVPRPTPHSGRWPLPGGRAAVSSVRGIVQGALHVWGLGPATASLTDRLAPLIQDVVARADPRRRGSLVLRLELHEPVRLLLGEVLRPGGAPGGLPGEEAGRGCNVAAIAATYGRRPVRDDAGAWYAHVFVWPPAPEAVPGTPGSR